MDFLKRDGDDSPVYDGEWYESEEGCVARVKEARKDFSRSGASAWIERATEDINFVNGHQWSDGELADLEESRRPNAVLNWVGRIINAVCGQQVANRQEPRYLGRSEQDFKKSDLATAIARWVRELGDEEDEDSQAFRDMVSCGMGWTVRRMEYDRDPEGLICKERLDPRRFRWDGNARRKNIADARWVQCDYFLSREDIAERWGKDKADGITIAPDAQRLDKNEPHDATNDWRYIKNQAHVDQMNSLFRVVHHVEWCRKPEYQIVNEQSGEIESLDEEAFETAKARAKEVGMDTPAHAKRLKRVYYHCWTVGNTALEFGVAPIQSDMSYQCMTGIRDDENGEWYGIARSLKDPQRLSNKLFIATLHSIATGAKGGLVVEQDAVENRKRFENDWAKSDAINWVKTGAIAGNKIMAKQPPVLPPEMGKLMEFMVGAIPQIAGANPEMLGQGQQDGQPGVVEAMRTKAGLIILAPWFDAMRLYTKRDGRVLAEFIAKFISDGRKIRIVGEEGPEVVELTGDMEWLKYDVIVDESTQSRDVKDRTFMALMQIAPAMMQMGVPPPPDALSYAPLPQSLVQKWQAEIKKKAEQPPAPPPQVQLEQMRQQGQQQLLAMKGEQEAGKQQLELQQMAATEAAQAESQERIEAAKTAARERELGLDMQLQQFKTVLDARLSAFETILKGMLELRMGQQQMEMEREQTVMEIQNGHRSGEQTPR